MAKKKGTKKKNPVTTATPSGLSIVRSNNKFTFSWKKKGKDAKDGQFVRYRIQTASTKKSTWSKWANFLIDTYIKKGGKKVKTKTSNLGPNVSSRTKELNLTDYYPYRNKKKAFKPYLKAISFEVKTNQKEKVKVGNDKVNPKASEYKDAIKTFEIKPPLKPAIVATFEGTKINRTTFDWAADHATNSHDWATHCYVYHRVRYESSKTPAWTLLPSKKGASTSAWSGRRVYTEQTEVFAKKSIIHEMLIVVRGPNGEARATASHTYARPRQADIYTNPTQEQIRKLGVAPPKVVVTDADGMTCTVYWRNNVDIWHPIDYTAVEYAIAVPEAGLKCPDDASWKAGPSIYRTGATDGATFSIDGVIGNDQILYVRVNNYHDTEACTAYGVPKIVNKGLKFTLANPTALSIVSSDPTTCRITINAQNNSQVPDSYLAVYFRKKTKDAQGKEVVSDEIIHTYSGGLSDIIQCPNWNGLLDYSFGVKAVVGRANASQKDAGFTDDELKGTKYTVYTIPTENMASTSIVWKGGNIPKAPTSVNLVDRGNGTVNVSWDWSWEYANTAELSWADHDDAWESTDEPSTYRIEGTHTPRWNIAGLDPGVKWFIRVRLIKANTEDNTETAGPWSSLELGEGHSYIDLASAPNVPLLDIPSYVTTTDEDFTASWEYSSTDGTAQDYAEICLVTFNDNNEIQYGDIIARNDGENGGLQNLVINPFSDPLNWTPDSDYHLAVRVRSGSGRFSDWSGYQTIRVVKPIDISVDMESTSLVDRQIERTEEKTIIVIDEETGEETDESETITVTESHYFLTKLPLNIKVNGAGPDDDTTITILRSEAYHLDRPDESDFDGFENELIATKSAKGDGLISIGLADLKFGASLDDTAKYKIICAVSDSYGQYKEIENPIEFIIDWEHQALMPVGAAVFDEENYISVITLGTPDPVEYQLPTGETVTDSWQEGDSYDIYRLSVDRPELIYENAKPGETYVDPYPTLGEYGGHLVVYKTIYGDYITRTNELAWVTFEEPDGDTLDSPYNIIDFDGQRVYLMYNLDLSSSWAKDFKETKYLGGHIQGDWNPAVSRTGSINTVSVTTINQETIQAMRRLATYPGICHVRTRDGSSYAADVQVSETLNHDPFELVSYSLTITRVDAPEPEGITLAQWEALQIPTEDIDFDGATEEEEEVPIPGADDEEPTTSTEGEG